MLKAILKGNRVISIFFLVVGLIMLGQFIFYPLPPNARIVIVIAILTQFLTAWIYWSSHKGFTPLMRYIFLGFAIITFPILIAVFFRLI